MERYARLAVTEAMRLGADYAESRLESGSEANFLLKNGVLEGGTFDDYNGLGVRLLVNNTWGYASTNQINSVAVRGMVHRAFDTAKASGRKVSIRLSEEKASKKSYEVKQRKALRDVLPEEKISYLKSLDDSLIRSGARLLSRFFSLSDSVIQKIYLNSEGSRIESRIPRIGLFYAFTIKGNSRSQQRFWEYGAAKGWEAVDSWKLDRILPEEAKALARVLSHGVKAPSNPLTVITGPQVSGIIAHESCGHPFETDRIFGREAAQAGESWINPAMLGQRLGTKAVNLVDDPAIKDSYGFYRYDDEGIKARKRYLVREGVINEFYHNRETAGAMSAKSNGSARASDFSKEPLVRMANTYFEPGEQSEQELMESVRKGVYFKTFSEWNIDDKRYNNRYVSSEAYLIQNGRITKPLRNVVFEITTPKIYGSIQAVGSNLELHAATCGKGEPMQGIPVTNGGGSLKLTGIKLR